MARFFGFLGSDPVQLDLGSEKAQICPIRAQIGSGWARVDAPPVRDHGRQGALCGPAAAGSGPAGVSGCYGESRPALASTAQLGVAEMVSERVVDVDGFLGKT